MAKELLNVVDIFENDEYVLMKAIYKKGALKMSELSVGFKDESGDIVRVVDVEKKYL